MITNILLSLAMALASPADTSVVVSPSGHEYVPTILCPNSTDAFLHDCAITEFKGKLIAAWYNCPVEEMEDASVIRGAISCDGGRTWGDVLDFIDDPDWLYVPPAFGTDGHRLYMFVSRMHGPDLVDDCETFVFNARKSRFRKVACFGDHFLPNTPASRLASGKWIIGGRVSDSSEERPGYPAVAISRGRRLRGHWDIVRISDTNLGPNGEPFDCPETGLVVEADGVTLTAFVRSHAVEGEGAYIYVSKDAGLIWSGPSPMPFAVEPVKITAGRLHDGRRYLLGNPGGKDRTELSIWTTSPDDIFFEHARMTTIAAGNYPGGINPAYHYPSVWETEGCLHLVFTCGKGEGQRLAAYMCLDTSDGPIF